MAILTADSLAITKTDCPTRMGERIATIAEITDTKKVPNPAVGMIIYVEDENQHYKVTELEDVNISGVTVPSARVKRWESFGSNEDIIRLLNKVFPLTASLTISPSSLSEYTGVARSFTISWGMTVDGEEIDINTADSVKLRVGGEEVTVGTPGAWLSSYVASAANDTKVEVEIVANGMTAKKEATINFAYPVYSGIVESFDNTEASIKALTKQTLADNRTRTIAYNPFELKRVVYAYAQTYGTLTGIVDANNINLIKNYTRNTAKVNGITYYVYVTTEPFTVKNSITYKFQ